MRRLNARAPAPQRRLHAATAPALGLWWALGLPLAGTPAQAAPPADAASPTTAAPALAPAAPAAPVGPWLDLQRAWALARQQDPAWQAAQAAAAAGREALPQAEAALRPQASFSVSSTRNQLRQTAPNFFGQVNFSRRDYESETAQLTVRQSVFQPGQTAALRQAESRVQESEAQLEQARLGLAPRLVGAYLNLLMTDEQLRLLQAQREAQWHQREQARRAFTAGSGTRTDVDEAQARLDLSEAQLLDVRQQQALARTQLAQLTGEPTAQLAPLDVGRLTARPPQVSPLDDWLDRAERLSPELAAQRARVEAAGEEILKLRARRLPTLDAIVQVGHGRNESVQQVGATNTTGAVGLQLTVPLASGGLWQSAERQALAEQDRQRALLRQLSQDLALRVQREHRNVTMGWERAVALAQAETSAVQLLHATERSLQAGVRTRLDVLNATQQLAATRRDLAQARLSTLLAWAQLHALAGDFDADRLRQLSEWLAPEAVGAGAMR